MEYESRRMQEDSRMSSDQCEFMDYMDEELAAILAEDFPGSLSPAGSDSSSSSTLITAPGTINSAAANLCTEPPNVVGLERPAKEQKPNNFSNFSSVKGVADIDKASSAPVMLNFGNANSPENCRQAPLVVLDPDKEAVVSEVFRNEGSRVGKRDGTGNKPRRLRPPSQTYDHIMAERKRREKLSQRFLALSSIVPGLKKMDKTSVLGDTIKYLKHLQERVKTLEEQAAKQTVESVVFVKRSHIMEDEGSSDEKNRESDELSSLPEIEARVCDKSILLKILCEKSKDVLVKVLAEVEKLNLAVVNTSVTPFGSLALDITINAQMNKEMRLAAKDMRKDACGWRDWEKRRDVGGGFCITRDDHSAIYGAGIKALWSGFKEISSVDKAR
ncbi:UNVERIFIED_CONTAM: Transcription factor [Sesamum calycinum]|uniref:Transcription factor n=1 Tax=Sesamum calycinum TaxID=2727403 RepID=A0AAW2MM07_9LAMI